MKPRCKCNWMREKCFCSRARIKSTEQQQQQQRKENSIVDLVTMKQSIMWTRKINTKKNNQRRKKAK